MSSFLGKAERYFTGVPCVNGHVAERYVVSKICVECNKENKARNKGKYAASERAYYEKNKSRYVENERRRVYGVTSEQWNAKFAEQGDCCAICKATEPGGKGSWHTDHCHTTKKFRGVLCHNCNLMLGYAKDLISTLQAACNYLSE